MHNYLTLTATFTIAWFWSDVRVRRNASCMMCKDGYRVWCNSSIILAAHQGILFLRSRKMPNERPACKWQKNQSRRPIALDVCVEAE
jgi:hypothetical protein